MDNIPTHIAMNQITKNFKTLREEIRYGITCGDQTSLRV